MTFTAVAVCRRTGKVGACKTTSTPAGGGRSFVVVPGIGAFTVQANTDFRLMDVGEGLLKFGYAPGKVLKEMQDSDRFKEHRQIGIVDARGETAAYSGPKGRPYCGHAVGNGVAAVGNGVAGQNVVDAVVASFEQNAAEELEERLLRAIEAGAAAGGQPDGQTSSALLVYDRFPFPIVNLRVDVALDPVMEMRRIFDWYKPLIPFYIKKNQDPTTVGYWKEVHRGLGLPTNPYAKK